MIGLPKGLSMESVGPKWSQGKDGPIGRGPGPPSGEYLANDVAFDIGQASLHSVVLKGQSFVVQSE